MTPATTTISEQGSGASTMASQIWMLAVHDMSHVALFIACFFVGWFVWSTLLRVFDPFHFSAPSQSPLIMKKRMSAASDEIQCPEDPSTTDTEVTDTDAENLEDVQVSPTSLKGR